MEDQLFPKQTSNKEKRRHLCSTCGSSFAKKSDLTRHERIHTGERPFKCNVCGVHFSQASSLKTHNRKHTGERPYKCQFCDRTYAHSHRLKSHVLKCHAEREETRAYQKCCSALESCGFQGPDDTYTFTMKQNSNEEFHEKRCCHCTCTVVSSDKQKSVHVSELISNKDNNLVELVEFSSVSSMKVSKSRLKSRRSRKNFMCEVCGSLYTDSAYLKYHLQSHDNYRPFTCNSCPQSFHRESSLKKHKIKHSLKRLFVCQVCGSSFNLLGNLKIHMRIHSGEKPYTCEDCGTKFTHSQTLKAHHKTHIRGRKKRLCKICGSSFPSMKFLNEHLQTHLLSSSNTAKSNESSHSVFVIQEASINEGLCLTSQSDFRQEQTGSGRQFSIGTENMNDSQCRSPLDGKIEKKEETASCNINDEKCHSRSPLTPPLNEIDTFPTFQDHYLSETENITPLGDTELEETESRSKKLFPFKISERQDIHDKGNGETSFISLIDQAEAEEEQIAFVSRNSQLSTPTVLRRSRSENSGIKIHLYSKDNFPDGECDMGIDGKTIDLRFNTATHTSHDYDEWDSANKLALVVKRDFINQSSSRPSSNTPFKYIDSFQGNGNAPKTSLTVYALHLPPTDVNEPIASNKRSEKIVSASNCVPVFPTIEGQVGEDSGHENEDCHTDSFSSNFCPPQKMSVSNTNNTSSTSSLLKSLHFVPIVEECGPLAEKHSLDVSSEILLDSLVDPLRRNLQFPSELEGQFSTGSGQVENNFRSLSSITHIAIQSESKPELSNQTKPLSSESFAPNEQQDSAMVSHDMSEFLTPVFSNFVQSDEKSQVEKLRSFSERNEGFFPQSISSDSPQLHVSNLDVEGEVRNIHRTFVKNDLMDFSISLNHGDLKRIEMDTLISTSGEKVEGAEAVSKSSFEFLLSKQGDVDSQSIMQNREASSSNVTEQEKTAEGETSVFKDLENKLNSPNPKNPVQAEPETHQKDESELKCANCPLGLFDASVISVLCQDECFGVMVERNSLISGKDVESLSEESREERKRKGLPDHSGGQSLQETVIAEPGNDLNLSDGDGSSRFWQSKEENDSCPVEDAIDTLPWSNETQQTDKTEELASHIATEQIMSSNAFGTKFHESSTAALTIYENQHDPTAVEGKDESASYSTLELEKRESRQSLDTEAEKQASPQNQHPTVNQENFQCIDSQVEKRTNLEHISFETERQESFQHSSGNEEKQPSERLISCPEKDNQQDAIVASRIQTNAKHGVKRKKSSFQKFTSKKRRTRKVILRKSTSTHAEYGCSEAGSFQIKRPSSSTHGCSEAGSFQIKRPSSSTHNSRCNACYFRMNGLQCPDDHQERSIRTFSHGCQICHLSFIFLTTLKNNFKSSMGKMNTSIKELHFPSSSLDDRPSECLLLGTHISCIINNPNFGESIDIQPQGTKGKETADFLCQICGESLSSLLLLNRHISGHNDNTYACNFCSAVFNKKSNLVKHMRIHNGDRPYKCQVCSRTFTQKTNLQVHMRTHTGETPFTCQQCGSSFAHSQALKLHMRFHAKDKRFVCQTCGKGFVVKAALDKHLLSHSQEKPFVCQVCDTRLSSKSSLSRHLKRHKQGQGLLPFFCSVCSARFAQPGHLKLHLKSHPSCRVTGNDSQASKEIAALDRHGVIKGP